VSAQESFTEKVALQRASEFLELMNGGNLEGLKEYIAPECVFHWPWPIPGTGPDYAIEVVGVTRSIFPDLVATPDQFKVSGQWVTVVATLTGTHSTAFLGIPATGKQVSFQAIFFGRVDENLQIAELWMESDFIAAGIQIAGAESLVTALLNRSGGESIEAPTAIEAMLDLDGVLFALDYSPDGKVVEVKSNLELAADEVEQAAALAPLLMTALRFAAERYNDISALNWTPINWAVYSAGDKWTIAFAGNRVIIAQTADVDFNALYTALVGPRG
jgi:roadblock/LC7 domain-containing protein/predicted ester cyclase